MGDGPVSVPSFSSSSLVNGEAKDKQNLPTESKVDRRLHDMDFLSTFRPLGAAKWGFSRLTGTDWVRSVDHHDHAFVLTRLLGDEQHEAS